MISTTKKGKLKRWDDDRGFGFIGSESDNRDIFIHISALKKMTRRPMIGDVINFEIHTDNDGKKRAVNASIEGVREIESVPRKRYSNQKNGANWISKFLTIALVVGIGFSAYAKFMSKNNRQQQTSISTSSFEVGNPNSGGYSCEGKVYCSEMTSCEEAKFYQSNCPGTKMDGDRDGIPCESQWCSY